MRRPASPLRLAALDAGLAEIIAAHRPEKAAVEEVFVNANPQSTLKLGQARGVILLGCAKAGLEPAEYAARLVKKAVVGTGGAEKAQVHAMVARLLPGREGRRRGRGGRARRRHHPRPPSGERAAALHITKPAHVERRRDTLSREAGKWASAALGRVPRLRSG